jgi:hypothetical protein
MRLEGLNIMLSSSGILKTMTMKVGNVQEVASNY